MRSSLIQLRFMTVGVFALAAFWLCLVPSFCPDARADDHTWTGGVSNDWNVGGNWTGGIPDGDDRVIFNNSSSNLATTNDLVDLGGMRIQLLDPLTGVSITGNALTLSADLSIDLSAAQKDLTLSIDMHQTGDTTYDVAANRTLTIEGRVDGPGTFLKKGDGVLFSDGNTLLCTTYDIIGGTLKLGSANVLPATSTVSIGAGAVFDLNDNNQTIGSLSGSGQVDLKSGNFTFGDANDTTFGGLIGGSENSGNVTKQGAGKVTLSGGERTRFTMGTLSINAGTLQVDNFWVSISVTVASGATLQGNGIIITPLGVVTINPGGNLAPGGSIGQLFCENGVTLTEGANFNVELNGTTAGSGYDQLIVDESLDLGSANLNLNLGFTPSNGDAFTIIDYLSSGAVTGTFNGLAEGATFTSGGTQFRITYAGGDGNDVVLTALVPPTITSFTPTSGSTGTTVTITGTQFTGTAVKFGGTDAASFHVDSPNRITAVVGAGSTGNVTVTTGGGTGTSASTFTHDGDPATLATGNPSSYKLTVTKVDMWNGTAWVTVFGGTAQLDMVTGGTFPGINDLNLPEGTYSRVKVTFKNSFPVTGVVSNPPTPYYTTATAFFGQNNLACSPTTVAGSMAEFVFYNPAWGALGVDAPAQTFDITPITVGSTTDYQPTLRFSISNTLLLKGTAGNPSSYFLSLEAPTGSLG